jgi:hypothetical protein
VTDKGKRPDEILERMAELIDAHEITIFNEEDAAALKQVAAMWRGLAAFGVAASVVRKVLTYLGWLVAAYFIVKGSSIEWIKGIIR